MSFKFNNIFKSNGVFTFKGAAEYGPVGLFKFKDCANLDLLSS